MKELSKFLNESLNESTGGNNQPRNNRELEKIVKDRIRKEGPNCNLNDIDVSKIKDMSYLFENTKFNGDISNWDVSHVEIMRGMFYGCTEFNGDISKWDVRNVKDMGSMFENSSFNGDLSRWDVRNVNNMRYMFAGSYFNGDIDDWDVRNVRDMGGMFAKSEFNGDIDDWDVSKVENMRYMFHSCPINHIPSWYKEN